MKTEITIGKKSDNQPATITMEDLPHLFVSWSEREALSDFYRDLLEQLIPKRNAGILEIAVCVSASALPVNTETDLIKSKSALLLRNAEGELSDTRLAFISSLRREFVRRQKLSLSPAVINKLYLKPLIVFVDDLIDLVITRNRNTGLYFLELLLSGPSEKIHFIMGSTRSYRGLVRQLVQFEKEGEPSVLDNYLPELVISPEGLLFYKRPEELNYTRLFSVREGIQ